MQWKRFTTHQIHLLLLLVIFSGAGFAYALIPPMLEKPDEDGHYGYILYLREHHALPPLMFQPGWASEYKQPPLYYFVAAVLTRWLPGEPVPERLLVTNPYADRSVPGQRNDNRNVFLHPPHLTPLFLGARVVSLVMGMGVVLLTYRLARLVEPQDHSLAIAAAAIAGFQPQFLYMATAINNDVAITLLSTATVTLLVYRFTRRLAGLPFCLILGSVLGLAILTKVSGLLLWLCAGMALLGMNWGNWRRASGEIAGVFIVALLIGGWWYIRNGLLYGDPFTLQVHVTGYQERHRTLADVWNYDIPAIERTFWANLSRLFVSPILLDHILIWWARISVLLGGMALLRSLWTSRSRMFLAGILLGWPGAYWIALLGFWSARAPWAYGRLLLPAITPLALMLALGWRRALHKLRASLFFPVTIGLLVVSGVLVPLVSLYPLYHPSRPWRPGIDVEWPGIIYTEIATGQPIARLMKVRPLQPYACPGTYVPVEICWEPLGQTPEPLPMFVHLLDLAPTAWGASPTLWGNRETYPGLGSRPTDRWPLRAPFCDRVLVWVFPDAPAPLCASVEIGFISQAGIRLQAETSEGHPLGLPVTGKVPILQNILSPPRTERPAYVLDGRIGLHHVEARWSQDSVTITVTWQALQNIPYDAITFFHLTDQTGNLLVQQDQQPLAGRFPTSCWLPGQVVTDAVTFSSVPARGEDIMLLVGMYTWPSIQRLPVIDREGMPVPDNAIPVKLTP
jgi:hypothetical protein